MDRVSRSIGICILVALLVIIVGCIPQEALNRHDGFEITASPATDVEYSGTRDVTEAELTNIAYEGVSTAGSSTRPAALVTSV